MSPVHADTSAPSLVLIEAMLTLIAGGLAFALPTICGAVFRHIEAKASRLSRYHLVSVLLVGVALCLLRIAILPWHPIPLPFSPNDFSFLLASDTFAHGRLTNPTPTMWVHFESIHIDMRPTYMSMYFPGQALVMAAGTVVFGHPWLGLLLASALMCSAICWMLQGWFPARWAFAGGLIAVLHLGLFSYWTNTYSGGASIAAIGGALVLGAAARWKREGTKRNGLLMGAGAGLLIITRPYEGALLCAAVIVMLVRFTRRRDRGISEIAHSLWPGALLLLCVIGWLGYYDYRAYGSPLTLPYTVNRSTYAVAPYYVWQPPRATPVYRYAEMRRFYTSEELDVYKKIHSLSGFLPQTLIKLANGILFFAGVALLPLLFWLPRALRDQRMRYLVLCLAVLIAGMLIEIYFVPHYISPFTAVIYAIGIQCLRHLRQWKPGGKSVGLAFSRYCFVVCVVVAGLRTFNGPLKMPVRASPASNWNCSWYGPDLFGTERAALEQRLEKMPGKQLVFVRYSDKGDPSDEWVYNAADINASKVIWAHAMDPAEDAALVAYYQDREAWVVEPDKTPQELEPYR